MHEILSPTNLLGRDILELSEIGRGASAFVFEAGPFEAVKVTSCPSTWAWLSAPKFSGAFAEVYEDLGVVAQDAEKRPYKAWRVERLFNDISGGMKAARANRVMDEIRQAGRSRHSATPIVVEAVQAAGLHALRDAYLERWNSESCYAGDAQRQALVLAGLCQGTLRQGLLELALFLASDSGGSSALDLRPGNLMFDCFGNAKISDPITQAIEGGAEPAPLRWLALELPVRQNGLVCEVCMFCLAFDDESLKAAQDILAGAGCSAKAKTVNEREVVGVLSTRPRWQSRFECAFGGITQKSTALIERLSQLSLG